MIDRVALGPVVAHHARDRVGHPVRQVDPGVAEADPGVGGGQQHLAASLVVVRVLDRADHRPAHHLDRPGRPDVADRVRALVGGSQLGIVRGGPLVEGQRGQRFDGVGEDIEAGAGGDHRRHGAGVVRIEDAHRRAQGAVGDPGFGVQRLVRSKMATPVVSLPVPAVVGIAISGLSGPGTGSARPIGALT